MKLRRLIVSRQAQRDVAAIIEWYRREMGAGPAAKTLRTLRAGFAAARQIHPKAARRNDLPEGYFRVVAKAHLVIFRIQGDEAHIVRVVHGSRDMPALFPES